MSMTTVVIAVVLAFSMTLDADAHRHSKIPRRGSFADEDKIKTNQPIIGILALETTGKITKDGSGQYLLGSYVKMLEAAGARVVPILLNQSPEKVEKLFNSINGVIFPGGHVKLQKSKYGTFGKQIYELAIKANQKGSVFPIWAECLGLELIALIESGRGLKKGQYDTALLSYTDTKNYSVPLKLTSEYPNSLFLGSADDAMINYMKTSLMAFNNHNKGIKPSTFNKFPKLKQAFRILSTNYDRRNVEYITTMEGRTFPFFLLQWHPSKAQYSWTPTYSYDHTQEAVYIAQFLVRLFVNQARMSDHKFSSSQEEQTALIKNYKPKETDDGDIYFFPMKK